jgi:threonine synthase
MFVTHLESALDQSILDAGTVQTVHEGRPLWVRYDLGQVRQKLKPEELRLRQPGLWKYRELLPLPVDKHPVSLGEVMTPLLPCCRLGQHIGAPDLLIKDESHLPTGSFKARGMTVAVSMARLFGIKRLAIPTAGNAGGALAAYGARAGMEVFVFMPSDSPSINQIEARLAGAAVFLVDGLISDCGRFVREGAARTGWFDMSTLREPYRLEGKKTMGLELAEQCDWSLPDVILYPTGGGTGLIGMWKAFAELHELGWLKSNRLPRLIACQSTGCAPIVRAFASGSRFAEPFLNAKTRASGLRVPTAVGDFMILDAVRASQGMAIAGDENRIIEWVNRVMQLEGIGICPETAICFDVLEQMVKQKKVNPEERVVVFNTAGIQKYTELVDVELPQFNKESFPDFEDVLQSVYEPIKAGA